MNEKYIINFSSLDSLKEKFENDKKNFTNSSYSTFSSSYVKKCSDYNIQQMSNQLDKLYLKIKESYEKMDKWLIEYINNTKGIEAKLSNKSGYSQISDSSLISQINNIKKLPTVTYDVKSSFNVKKSNNNAFSSTLETRNKVTTPNNQSINKNTKTKTGNNKIDVDKKLYSDEYIENEFKKEANKKIMSQIAPTLNTGSTNSSASASQTIKKAAVTENKLSDEEFARVRNKSTSSFTTTLETRSNVMAAPKTQIGLEKKKFIVYGTKDGLSIECDNEAYAKARMKKELEEMAIEECGGNISNSATSALASSVINGAGNYSDSKTPINLDYEDKKLNEEALKSFEQAQGHSKIDVASATAVFGTSIGEGVALFGEGVYDSALTTLTLGFKSGFYIKANGETTDSFTEWLEDTKNEVENLGFEFEYIDDGYFSKYCPKEKLIKEIKTEHVKDFFDSFYETNSIGKSLKDSSGAAFDITRGVGNSLGYVAPAIAATVVTGGAGASGVVASAMGAGVTMTSSFGSHVEEALNNGASLESAKGIGAAGAMIDAAQFFAGANVNAVSTKVFSSIANPFVKSALISATNVTFDSIDGATSTFVDPFLQSFYAKGYVDSKTGKYVEFDKNASYFEKFGKMFENTGGWSSVLSNSLLAGALSAISEGIDLPSKLNSSKNDININNPNMADNNNLKSIEKNKVRRVNTKSSISDSLEKFDNAIRLKDDNDIKSFFGTHREFNDPRYAFTYREITEREGYVEVAGPVIGAYLRGSDVDFYTKRGERQIYHADKESLKVYLEQMHGRGYYMDKNDYKSIVESMDNMIKKSSPLQEDTILYRGVNNLFFKGEKLNITSIKVGDLINDKAFTSTSVIKDACYDQNDIVLEILAPKGTKGTYLGKNAKEWLLSRNTTLKILSRPEPVNGKIVIKAEIYSQTPIEKIKNVFNKFSRQSDVSRNLTQQQNVVRDMDLSNNKHLTSKSNYNNLFNKLNGGVDVDDFVDYMEKKGLMANYEDKIIDIDNLYRRGSKIAEHDVSHVERVMLYSMYMGDKLNLSEHNMDLLAQAAKYHDVGVYAGHSGHSYVSANEVVENLKGKYSTSDVNKIAAIIEYHEVDELGRKFDDLLAKSNMSISHDLSLNDFRKNLSDNNKNELDKVISKISGIVDISDMSTVDFKNIIDSEDFQNFANICRKYSIPMDDIMDVKEIADILKDADAIDRTRFINNLNVNYFRNKDLANSLVKTSYQMQEIRGKLELDKILAEGTSLDKIQKINLYRNKGVPDYLIDFAIKYKSGNIDNFIEQYMRRN